MRVFHGCLRRALAGVLGAGVLVLAIPVPSMAAPTPSVTITDVTVAEGTGGTVNANLTIQAAPAPKPGAGLQVSWATASASATAPADFTSSSGTVSLTKNSASKVVSVPVVGDALDEANETFVVNLFNLVGSPGTIGDGQGVATITDNDPLPVLSVNDVSVTEGNAGTTTAAFTISLSAASGRPVTFDWGTTVGSATAGTDYIAASGSRTIAAGTTFATVGVTVNGDVADEFDETFGITLSNPGNATIGDGSGLATISDDDPVPVLSVTDASVTEGNAGTTPAPFTVTLSAASGKTVTVDWTTADGSATQPSDYTAASGTLTFVPGDSSEPIGVPVNGDVIDEVNETFGISLSNPGNATIGDGSGQGTITDDDAAPTLSVNDVTVAEGNAGTTAATFTVTLSAASSKAVTFDWATAAGSATAGTDYVAVMNGSKTIAAGSTTTTFTVTVNGDVVDEANETYGITLSNPGNATIGDGSGQGTITDDDAAPTLSVNDVTVVEGNAGTSTATFTVSLSAASGQAVTFDWATAAGSATAGTDYVAGSGSKTIAASLTTATLTVTVNGDVLDELDETYGITLSNPGNATIADGSGFATITDDDAAPTLSIDDFTAPEGDAGTTATFTVTLSTASGKTVTVDWTTANGSATQPSDFTAGSGTLTFVPGDTSEPIAVTVNGDVLDELDETYGITLSNPGNATIADGSGLGTITDDDAAPTLSVDDVTVTEGNAGTTTATFTVTLSAASGKTVTVDWATADDSATKLDDYAAALGTATFTPGDTSETFVVNVNGDLVAELDEAFRVTLSGPSNATLGDSAGIGTIVDDELLPVIDIDDDAPITIVEGQSGTALITFTVMLSHPSALPVTVDWSTSAGTATSGTDYVGDSRTVTFAPLDDSETVQVTVYGDGTFEGDENFSLDLSNNSGAPIGDAQGVATIVNDDAPPVASIANGSKTEGNTGTSLLTFSISLVGDSDVDATFDWATSSGTATAGPDYVAGSGTLTIPAGSTTGTVNVVVNGDVAYEPNETLSLTLTNPTGATIVDGVAQGTITNDDKRPTTLTLQVVRKPSAVVAKGLLEPTTSGHRVTVTLFRKQGGKFVKVAAKTVSVRYLKDRDGDGKTDGSYTATFIRPKTKGSYKILARFKGTATYKPCSRGKVFTLAAS